MGKRAQPVEQVTPGAEPDGEVTPVEAATQAAPELTPEQQEADLRQKISDKSFSKHDARAAMWAKRSEMAAAERAELVDSDAEQAQALDDIAGATQGDPEEIDAAAAAADDADAPLALPAEKVKIVVDGQEREVPRDEVIKAGVATLQKQAAADVRLQEAATYEARVRDWARTEHEKLQEQAAALAQRQASPPPPATGAQAPEDVQASVSKALELLVDGEKDEAAKLLTSVFSRSVPQAAPATPAGPADRPHGAEVQAAVTPPPARRSREELAEANRIYSAEYADIDKDDRAYTFTQSLVQASLRDPANAFRPIGDIVREAGNKARSVFAQVPQTPAAPAAQPASEPSPGQQALEGRRTLKARIPISPTGASVRATTASQAPAGVSNKDYIQQLQRRSGSNAITR